MINTRASTTPYDKHRARVSDNALLGINKRAQAEWATYVPKANQSDTSAIRQRKWSATLIAIEHCQDTLRESEVMWGSKFGRTAAHTHKSISRVTDFPRLA